MAIPGLLAYLLLKMKVKLQYNWIIWMFVAFIFGCGMTHFMNIIVFYNPIYRLDGLIKLFTGIISIATVTALAWLVPKAIAASNQITPSVVKIVSNLNHQLRLYYLLIAALVIMVGSDIWGLTNINKIKESSTWRSHTYQSLQKIEDINKTLIEAETTERGFILTGEEEYANKIIIIEQELTTKLNELEEFVKDNPSQIERITIMRKPINERITNINNAIEVRKNQGIEAAIKSISFDHDKLLKSEILKYQNELTSEEEKLLVDRTNELDNGMDFVIIINLSASVIGVIIISVVFIVIIKQSHTLQNTLSALKISEQQLEESNKELSQFAYVASHDLKAPLRGINSLAGWVEEDLKDVLDDKTKKHLQQMKERTSRMNSLIEGILQYSRIGRLYVSRKKINLNELISSILDGLEKKKYVFKIGLLPTIVGNQIVLTQLFSNLLENTIKHNTRDNIHVSVTVQDESQYYRFSIKDNGVGIAKELQSKLFVMFQTLGTTGGTGIGLALCKKIVEEVGGNIWVESDIGGGANFIFTWPKNLNECE